MYYSRSHWLETPLFAIPVTFVQETQRPRESLKNKLLELESTIDPFKNR